MSRRSIVSLAVSVIIGSACIVATSNDTSAYPSSGIPIYQPGVYRGGVSCGGGYRGAYYRGGYYRGVAPGECHHANGWAAKLNAPRPRR